MRRAALLVAAIAAALATASSLAFVRAASAQAPRRAPAPPPAPAVHATPSAPLPALPVIASVRVDVARDHVVVTEDIVVARGEMHAGDLSLFVAFGAPGAPRAFDARLFAADPALLAPIDEAVSEPVAVERAPRRPKTALLLLGRPQMSGAVVHVREPAFRRAVSAAGAAMLRLRTLLEIPQEDAAGGRELVIRLGTEGGAPLTLTRLELHAESAHPAVLAAEAMLCGGGNGMAGTGTSDGPDPYPIAVTLSPTPRAPSAPAPPAPVAAPIDPPSPAPPRPTAPWLVVRHATDDLCLRFHTDKS